MSPESTPPDEHDVALHFNQPIFDEVVKYWSKNKKVSTTLRSVVEGEMLAKSKTPLEDIKSKCGSCQVIEKEEEEEGEEEGM